jgi:hypothetical protein
MAIGLMVLSFSVVIGQTVAATLASSTIGRVIE